MQRATCMKLVRGKGHSSDESIVHDCFTKSVPQILSIIRRRVVFCPRVHLDTDPEYSEREFVARFIGQNGVIETRWKILDAT